MPKKGENIYKRKDGRWEGRYIIDRTNSGKAIYKSVYAYSYLETKRKLIKLKYVYQQNIPQNALNLDKLMISTVSYEWLKIKKMQIKESSFVKYTNVVENYIVFYIGSLKLKKVTLYHIEIFISNLLKNGGKQKKPLSTKTIADIVSILKRIFQYAIKKYKIALCDLNDLKIKLNINKQPIQVLSKSEYKRLIQYLLNNFNRINMGILLVLFTGIRIGELCALKYKNISIDETAIIILETLQRIQNKNPSITRKTKIIITSPKSSSSIRKIPIPLLLMNLIIKTYKTKNSFILTGTEQKFIEPRTIQNHFYKILKDIQIKKINFHSLRHTFATQCLLSGMDVKSLSEILGHANINVTLNKYVHPSFEEKKQFIDKLGQSLIVK